MQETGTNVVLWDLLAERFGDSLEAVLIPGAPRLMNRILDRLQRRTLRPILSNMQFNLVVEVGVGVGRWVPYYTRKDAEAIAIDISRSMLRVAKRKVASSMLHNIDFILASAQAIPLRSSIADLTLSITCVQHIMEKSGFHRALREIFRCTRRFAIFLESTSRKKPMRLDVYYPTIILPIQDYTRMFDELRGRIVRLRGVDFLPFFWFLERFRDIVYIHHPGLKIPLSKGSLNTRFMRGIYHAFACILIVLSLPLTSIFGDSLVFSKHFLAVVDKVST